MSLANLSEAFDGMRKQCKEWKYRYARTEADLEELRMMLHQYLYTRNPVARSYLLAIGRDHQLRLDAESKKREELDEHP